MFFDLKQRLFKSIDIAPLAIFRILFGLLLFAETLGAILTGWVRAVFIDPQFTFSHIGFEWLQPLPGNGMYYFYGVMAILAIFITLGYYYKFTMSLFSVMWWAVYLMQKSSYNNHYYLIVLLCFLMIIMPAHRYFSLDVKRKPHTKLEVVPNWTSLVFITQIFIVYTYAAIAKLYPDWLEGITVAHFFNHRSVATSTWLQDNMTWLASTLENLDFIYSIPHIEHLVAYSAIMFDLLVVPGLLWKRTRKFTFALAIVFHLFNSISFGIGVFPYLALALCIFCFDPDKIRRRILPKKKPIIPSYDFTLLTRRHNVAFIIFLVYFSWQALLPIRHHLFDGDVLWNEAGHRLSWRMMLRSRSGTLRMTVYLDGKAQRIHLKDYLTRKQIARLRTQPDFMWQFAQRIRHDFEALNYSDVKIKYTSFVGVNGKRKQQFVDPTIDIAHEEWNRFNSQSWILPYNHELDKE